MLAEVVLGDDGTEWVTYGVPMDENAKPDEDQTHVQLGSARSSSPTSTATAARSAAPTTPGHRAPGTRAGPG
ncbi:hypothetical protein DAI43_28600 [Achromobacter xylosoxidans]|nr:hypothetical protein DAI43_28600 [Achromobacter xylosoxidans]